MDLQSPYGQRLRHQRAPGVCGYHRVWFSLVTLRSTRPTPSPRIPHDRQLDADDIA
ncbi:MAG: hypothetical protein OXC06_12080 [Acidimicrobiaceae bacterium]|nr:hypothetical protein [Acidimicrobiaceae bacterium]